MPRIGQNPAKLVRGVHQPARITLTTVVHIPELSGFWSQSLEVLKLCLTSMAATSAGVECEIVVLDNASCPEVRRYLLEQQEQGLIHQLILSGVNLGKVGAWNVLFGMAQGEVIGFTDSDVYFLPGWLEESLKILEAFPRAGMVTAQPIAGGDLRQGATATMCAGDREIASCTGRLIADHLVNAQLDAVGADAARREEVEVDRCDVLLSRHGVSAYATGSHFQFVTRKSVVQSIFPAQTHRPLGDDHQFDVDMVRLGFYRLATCDYLVHHVGNRFPMLEAELPWVHPTGSISHVSTAGPSDPGGRILRRRLVRRWLKRIHGWSYRALWG